MDVFCIMSNLAKHRPVFHNEADFQFALAWSMQQHQPESTIRLEERRQDLSGSPAGGKSRAYIDIVLRQNGQTVLFEIKYKTDLLSCTQNGEEFDLKYQSADDTGRYSFLWDIHRIETCVIGKENIQGWAIFLTNDET